MEFEIPVKIRRYGVFADHGRTRVVGAFPDGQSALMLVAARLRHVAGTRWGTKKYLRAELLKEVKEKAASRGA